MRKIYSVRAFLTLCILAVSSLIGGVSAQAQYYELVTSVDQLNDGDKCLIVNTSAGKALSTTQNGNNRGAAAVTITDNKIETVETKVCVLTLERQGDKWAFNTGNGYLYAASSSKNYLRTEKTLSDNSKATITIDATGATTIQFTGSYTHNLIQYNSSNNIFSCYGSSQQPVVLFRYVANTNPKPAITFSSESYEVQLFGETVTVAATATLEGSEISGAVITYTSSDLEVATVDAETGVVTAKKEGTVTITAKVEETETYAAASATCELTVVDPRTAPEFSFAEEVYTVKLGQSVQIQATTNSTGVITYISSNEGIVEIDGAGNVTAKAEGEATITATIAETNEYKSTTATCLIKVVDPDKPAAVVTPMLFKEVTSTDQLIEGGQYIVVCKENKVAMTTVSSKGASTAVTIEEDGSIKTVPSNVVVYTMSNKTADDYFNLVNGDGKYLGTANTGTNLTTSTDHYDTKTQWKLDGDNGIACKNNVTGSASRRSILYNGTQFGHYAVSNIGEDYAVVQLYRLEAVATINEKIGYTTYYTDEKYQMPEGLTGYAITEAQEAGAVVMTPAYEAGADVPANTALLLGGEAGTYGLPVLNKEVEATYARENLLEGRRTVDNVTNSAHEDVFYYKLTLLNGENPGFYWGAADGAAFEMKSATTAYLAVSKSVPGVNGFRLIMGEGDTTGIGTAATAPAAQDAAIYTLSGVRVNAATTAGLPKGIYIVNGKKLLVK